MPIPPAGYVDVRPQAGGPQAGGVDEPAKTERELVGDGRKPADALEPDDLQRRSDSSGPYLLDQLLERVFAGAILGGKAVEGDAELRLTANSTAAF